jgi:hypothetical protein
MTESVVTFVDDYGDDVQYKRYAARLPDFLKAYPPADGYRVEIERTDLLSQQKGLLSLLREAIIAGKKPSDVGIPGIERIVNVLVCTAKLLSPQNQVIRSASASMNISEHKDFETLETAANQRLIAALGFGGEVFNQDEDADLRAQGREVRPSAADPAPSGESERSTPSSGAPLSFAEDTSRDRPASLGADPQEDGVTEAERRQIENLARRVGAPVPTLRTRADVKAARQQLSAKDRERRGAGTRPLEATG